MPLFEHLESRQNNVRLDMKFSIGLWNSWILYVDDSKVAQPSKKEVYFASLWNFRQNVVEFLFTNKPKDLILEEKTIVLLQ